MAISWLLVSQNTLNTHTKPINAHVRQPRKQIAVSHLREAAAVEIWNLMQSALYRSDRLRRRRREPVLQNLVGTRVVSSSRQVSSSRCKCALKSRAESKNAEEPLPQRHQLTHHDRAHRTLGRRAMMMAGIGRTGRRVGKAKAAWSGWLAAGGQVKLNLCARFAISVGSFFLFSTRSRRIERRSLTLECYLACALTHTALLLAASIEQ